MMVRIGTIDTMVKNGTNDTPVPTVTEGYKDIKVTPVLRMIRWYDGTKATEKPRPRHDWVSGRQSTWNLREIMDWHESAAWRQETARNEGRRWGWVKL